MEPATSTRLLRHIAAAIGFAALAVVWTYPLARHGSTHILGGGAGDNVAFLWNFWWMRAALEANLAFFRTDYLFVPTGVDLILHTHTALPAFVGATALGKLPIVAALNATVLFAIFLSAFGAYLLAWRITRSHSAAAVAGLIFGGSPFMSAHLNGHFNLTSAWTVPLFAFAISEALTRKSPRWSGAAGLVLGTTVYVDYYLFVYEAVLAACLLAIEAVEWRVFRGDRTPRSRMLVRIMAFLVVLDSCALIAIFLTGGFTIELLGARISARTAFNPLQALWVFVAVGLWAHVRPRVAVTRRASFDGPRIASTLLVTAAVFLVVAAPVLWKGMGLLLRGEYVTQRYFWRSAPKGIDIATLVLGNQFNGLWGHWTQRLYDAMRLDGVDVSGWLGLVPMILAAWTLRWQWQKPVVRRWTAIGALFFVWALGPHLMAFGMNTGMILPQALMRHIPLLSNARIPARAMVMVYLALAMLCAVAVAEYRFRSRSRGLAVALIGVAIVADYVPAPFPVTAMDHPAIYDVLRSRPEGGAVCELPLGVRDGFGERGLLDERVLFYQSIHERPLVGGFVARLPPAVLQFYEKDPLLSTFLRLSGDTGVPDVPPPDRKIAGELLNQHGIRFVVVNRVTASQPLTSYVERSLPLTTVFEDAERTLYVVTR